MEVSTDYDVILTLLLLVIHLLTRHAGHTAAGCLQMLAVHQCTVLSCKEHVQPTKPQPEPVTGPQLRWLTILVRH